MLEVKNLTKSYKSKKGGETQALKGISLKFADTGLVFILGKSGCGKSTFLNLLGGLDSFDDGEIIVNGKSSKDFTAADFDSYRNTYLGFVFQEFNIIETFSIEKNIGLALQLQHRKSDKGAIEEILKKVELEGFGARRPNELSGGQKQRVAIARALIKDPEIILADEPTGALDSATGKSVLNMLKKLAKDKLVIVVSHDREFAEEYADRIVELKDGVVISDRTRDCAKDGEVWREEITSLNSNIILIPKGKPLDEKTINEINNELINSKTDTFLMLGEEKNADLAYPDEMKDVRERGFKSANAFGETDQSKISSEKPAMQLIKSKLPLGDAFKIGASNFKSKKFRLVITVLLSILALSFFGFADIFASYNRSETYAKALYEGDARYMEIGKQVVYDEDAGYTVNVPLSSKDVQVLTEHFSGKILKGYSFQSYSVSANYFKASNDKFFQPSAYNGFLETKEDADLVAYGSFPKDNTEVMISDYMADGYLKLSANVSTTEGAKEYVFPSYDQIIGYTLTIDGYEYKISGVYKTNYYSAYSKLSAYNEQELNEDKEAMALQSGFNSDRNAFYGKLVVKDGFSDMLKSRLTTYYANLVPYIESTEEYVYRQPLSVTIDDTGALKRGEIVIPAGYYREIKYGYSSTKTLAELNNDFLSPQELPCYIPVVQWFSSDDASGKLYEKTYSVIGVYDDGNLNNGGGIIVDDGGIIYGEKMAVTNVAPGGVVATTTSSSAYVGEKYVQTIYMNAEDFKDLVNEVYAPSSVLADARLSGADLINEVEFLHKNSFSVAGRSDGELGMVDNLMKSVLKIFYIIAAVLAVFVTLLLYNFISTSIVNKKKEIGILRAIGARGVDIAKIFIFESLLIGAIILVISFPLVISLTGVLQDALISAVSVNIISFKIRQVFTMTGITLLILLISSIIPVLRISKRKPIDAILDK